MGPSYILNLFSNVRLSVSLKHERDHTGPARKRKFGRNFSQGLFGIENEQNQGKHFCKKICLYLS